METDNRTPSNTQRYDSRSATRKEMSSILTPINIDTVSVDVGGLPILHMDGLTYIDGSDSHSIIFGATGSKKTRLICMPTLRILAQAGESFIASDPKGELYTKTSGLLDHLGYSIYVMNLREPRKGFAWNPLSLPYELYTSGNKDKAMGLVNDLVINIMQAESALARDPFWDRSASDFCFGLIMLLFEYAASSEINLRSVALLRDSVVKNKEQVKKILDPRSITYSRLSGTLNAPSETQGSILSVFDQHMHIFSLQDDVAEMLAYSSFSYSALFEHKVALFIIMPDEKTTYHKLVSLFLKQAYEVMIDFAQQREESKLKYRINLVLDEFSNLPPISDFPAMITASRSRNIRFMLVLQSNHQLKSKYGHEAETIKSNCFNRVYLPTRELELLKEASELCGLTTGDRPLYSVAQLQRLNKEYGQALTLIGNSYPYIAELKDIDKYPSSLAFTSMPLLAREAYPFSAFLFDEYLRNREDFRENHVVSRRIPDFFSGRNEIESIFQDQSALQNDISEGNISAGCAQLVSLAMDKYLAKDFDTASIIFSSLYEIDPSDETVKNNLAYMKRRGEGARNEIPIRDLLENVTNPGDAFRCINLALCILGKVEYEFDVDAAIQTILAIQSKAEGARDWWNDTDVVGISESNLVLLLLEQTQKIQVCSGDVPQSRFEKIDKNVYTLPDDFIKRIECLIK